MATRFSSLRGDSRNSFTAFRFSTSSHRRDKTQRGRLKFEELSRPLLWSSHDGLIFDRWFNRELLRQRATVIRKLGQKRKQANKLSFVQTPKGKVFEKIQRSIIRFWWMLLRNSFLRRFENQRSTSRERENSQEQRRSFSCLKEQRAKCFLLAMR